MGPPLALVLAPVRRALAPQSLKKQALMAQLLMYQSLVRQPTAESRAISSPAPPAWSRPCRLVGKPASGWGKLRCTLCRSGASRPWQAAAEAEARACEFLRTCAICRPLLPAARTGSGNGLRTGFLSKCRSRSAARPFAIGSAARRLNWRKTKDRQEQAPKRQARICRCAPSDSPHPGSQASKPHLCNPHACRQPFDPRQTMSAWAGSSHSFRTAEERERSPATASGE